MGRSDQRRDSRSGRWIREDRASETAPFASTLKSTEPIPENALDHLLSAAERQGFSVATSPSLNHGDRVAEINMEEREIRIASDEADNSDFMAMALAHELGHASDPYYKAHWMGSNGEIARADREIVAQTAAEEFCALYGIDVSQASDQYRRAQLTRMNRLLRLRTDVALCSMLPVSPKTRTLLDDAERRWRWRWMPFAARRGIPISQPLLRTRYDTK